jgi:hypothetical protein
MGNSRNKKAREMRKAGRTAEFTLGTDKPHGWDNKPGSSTYTFANGLRVGVREDQHKVMGTGEPGFRGAREWHPADKAAGVQPHNTYMEYAENCKKCEALDDRHPQSDSPWK